MNIRKIAEMTGVSVASVSRALNPTQAHKVSPKLRKRILDACERVRYMPNTHTVRMLSRRSNTIAMLIPEESVFTRNSGFRNVGMDDSLSTAIAGAESEAAKHSVYLLLRSVTPDFVENREHVRLHRSKSVDGILIWGWIAGETYIEEIVEEEIPCVMMQTSPPDMNVASVVPEDYEGMRELTELVLSKGHRRIAIVSPSVASSAGEERSRGMLDALRESNLEPALISSATGFSIETGEEACAEILEKTPDVTCVMAANDLSALGVLKEALSRGLDVPRDISVTGADGLDFHGLLDLTTYASPAYEVGQRAMASLLEMVESKKVDATKTRLPVTLVPGATVADIAKGS